MDRSTYIPALRTDGLYTNGLLLEHDRHRVALNGLAFIEPD
jgi:hypothetical protein